MVLFISAVHQCSVSFYLFLLLLEGNINYNNHVIETWFYKNILKPRLSWTHQKSNNSWLVFWFWSFFAEVGFHQHNIQKDLFSWAYSASDSLTVCSCLHLLCFCCFCARIDTHWKENCFLCLSWLKSTSSRRFYPTVRLTEKTQRIETKFSAVWKYAGVAGQWTRANGYLVGEGRNLEFCNIAF